MKCPNCSEDLKRTDFGEHGFVILDVCSRCNGTWFDKGELDRLDESIWVNVEGDLEFRHSETGRNASKCPACDASLEPLSPKDQPELIVDRCTGCEGFWLDSGELEKIQNIAEKMDQATLDKMTHFKKPADWSMLRWLVYCYKTFK